ncbi:uncharacterized protein LOC130806938 [Amaranthus tricolor]|uniref:uncharacterized protein LOC130806938 n=1 Tax=Amaranthus tricolor TaxID=29722 RepID=UPI00258932B7|nr:uncharacterized protein LOC130806938 [Amaranthus tricolor]
MKEDEDHQHRHYHHRRRFWKLSSTYLRNHKHTAYTMLLILTYAFGYFTAFSSLYSKQSSKTLSTTINCPPPTRTRSWILHKYNDHNRFGPECKNPVPPELIRSTILKKVYNGKSPYTNFPPAHWAKLIQPKSITGWGSYGAVFENLIKKVRPKVIIEIGSFLGASATHMAELTRNLGLETQILCIDDFRGWLGFRDQFKYVGMENGDVLLLAQFLQNVVSLNSTESILPIPFSTGTTLDILCKWGIMGDLIEVDAGHDFHSAWVDINLAHKLLKPGGVMFGHDYFNGYDRQGVRRAVDLFAKVHGFNVSVDGEHWVIV